MKRALLTMTFLFRAIVCSGQIIAYTTESDLAYYPDQMSEGQPYIQERCVLDLYYPEGEKGFAAIIWFHGGGLTAGQKEIPEALKQQGVAIIGVNYRLYPKVKAPGYIEDAAAALAWAWTFKNIESYGGDAGKIFISGHSAGGYLASMIGLDKKWLA